MINLERLLDQQEPAIRRGFLAMVSEIQDSWTLGELEDLIEQGRLSEALQTALKAAPSLATAAGKAFLEAAEDTARQLGRSLGQVIVNYDMTNEFAVARMRQNRLRLVQNFTEQQIRATQQALLEGVTRGENPRETARRFRNSIGLTESQQRTLDRYENALRNNSRDALRNTLRDRRSDRSVLRALERGEPLSDKQIQSMVDRYRQRLVGHRAKVIARTEALRSVHEGSAEMLRQAREDGTLDGTRLVRTWNTAKDERVRGSHRKMHRQQRGENEPFLSGLGNLLMYPGDSSAPARDTIQCRCVVATTIEIEELANASVVTL